MRGSACCLGMPLLWERWGKTGREERSQGGGKGLCPLLPLFSLLQPLGAPGVLGLFPLPALLRHPWLASLLINIEFGDALGWRGTSAQALPSN